MFYHGSGSRGQSFRLIRQAFLQGDGLPFGEVLSEEEIEQAFEAEDACFAQGEGDIYTPAITPWAFSSQVLHAGRLRSCTAAVSRVIVLCVALGRQPPSPDTGAYCRARAQLPERVLQRLVYDLADELESRVPADWLWQGRHPYDLRSPSQGPPLSMLSAASSFPDIFAQIVCPLTLRAVDIAIQV